MTSHIETQRDGAVLTIRFNRPDKKNALLSVMYADAAAALKAAAADSAVRVVVITGTADSFTAGNDLKDFLENPPTGPEAPVFQFMRALANFPKPAIAAVNGLAIGIGVTLLLHCDLIYAVPTAKFQLPFVNIAIVPEFASSLLLPRLVGQARAAELLLLGEMFTAARALELGLINGVVEPDALLATALEKAKVLASKAPAAVRHAKALLRTPSNEIAERIAVENDGVAQRLGTAEFREAATAFFEKRAPDFSKFD
jgi:enoyl-CoA hydratase/carnithine racemase